MKLFACQACSQSLYFESEHCERCDRKLGYLPEHAEITALEPVGEAPYRLYEDGEATYRFCANHTHDVCNWLIREDSQETFCAACRFNRTIPDLSNPRNLHLYRIIENGKHRLVYSMMRLRLPLVSKSDDEETGLAFDFLADENDEDRVLTGHADGVITLNIAEADSAERERTRQNMREPYRTVLGHFRHEIAHYYCWSKRANNLSKCEICSETTGKTTGRHCKHITTAEPRRIGRNISSVFMPVAIRGKTGQKPGHTIFIWWTRWKPLMRLICVSAQRMLRMTQ